MPNLLADGSVPTISFKNLAFMLKCDFVIFADLEAILENLSYQKKKKQILRLLVTKKSIPHLGFHSS